MDLSFKLFVHDQKFRGALFHLDFKPISGLGEFFLHLLSLGDVNAHGHVAMIASARPGHRSAVPFHYELGPILGQHAILIYG